MVLTNKVDYLLTEYQKNCQPLIVELTAFLAIISGLKTSDLIGSNFDNLSTSSQNSATLEVDALRVLTIAALTPKIVALGQQIATQAGLLVTQHTDHIVGMTENVDNDARTGELGAQTTSLKTTITGMVAILPGGGAGAALVTAENAPTLIQLAQQDATKLTQIASASLEIPQLAQAGVELTNFVKLLSQNT
jgi:hypothetical protein